MKKMRRNLKNSTEDNEKSSKLGQIGSEQILNIKTSKGELNDLNKNSTEHKISLTTLKERKFIILDIDDYEKFKQDRESKRNIEIFKENNLN